MDKLGIFHVNQTSLCPDRLQNLNGQIGNMFKPSSNFLTDCSKAVLLLWILFVICVLSLSYCLVCFSPAGKRPTSWLSCMYFFLVFLSLSHMVSLVRCGT